MPMKTTQAGFSLLEALVAMIVIFIGVLGMAGIQMKSAAMTDTARYQSLAALIASSVSAQMQANPVYWLAASGTVSVTGSSVSGGPVAGIAYLDLQSFGQNIASVLPGGTGQISCTPNASGTNSCSISLSWSEKNISISNTIGASGLLAQQYSTLVTIR